LGLDEVEGEGVADVIVMHDVLEHIADDRAAVARLWRLMVEDGRLVLSVPALPSLFGFHDEQLGHHRRYTRRALQAVLASAFSIERLRYFGFSLVPITAYYSRLRRRPYPTGSAESGLLSRAFGSLCSLEARIPTPLGTSLVCLARPRRDVSRAA
jgi:SAM-dependent methyltransferase